MSYKVRIYSERSLYPLTAKMCKEGNCHWDLKHLQIIREQPALQDTLPGARSSSQLRQKLVSITRLPKAEGLLLLILSKMVWASVGSS